MNYYKDDPGLISHHVMSLIISNAIISTAAAKFITTLEQTGQAHGYGVDTPPTSAATCNQSELSYDSCGCVENPITNVWFCLVNINQLLMSSMCVD